MTNYICESCNYKTDRKSSYEKHTNTRKHKVKQSTLESNQIRPKLGQMHQKLGQKLGHFKKTPENETNTPNKKLQFLRCENIELKHEINELKLQLDSNENIICEYCSKEFKHVSTKCAHITELRCKMIPSDERQRIKDKYKNKRIKNMTITKNNNCHNTNNNTTTNTNTNSNNNIHVINNTTLNSYTTDQYDHITDEEVIKTVKSLEGGLGKFMECKLEDMGNRNVYLFNLNSCKALVFTNPKWTYKEKNDVLDYKSSKDLERLRCKYETIKENMTPEEFEKIISLHSQQRFDTFMDKFDRYGSDKNKM